MVRRKRKRNAEIPSHKEKSSKLVIRQQDQCYNPIGTRIYFSLITNHLQIPCGPFITSICDHNNGSIRRTFGEITVTTSAQEIPFIDTWINTNDILYLMTFDECIFPKFDTISLPYDIKRVLTIKNAGGSSEISEALSMRIMNLKYDAFDFIPEMEVEYSCGTKICDYIMKIKNKTIGVSVTRAISYPLNGPFTPVQASTLLYKKLIGLLMAKKTVIDQYHFDTSVIHIWCKNWDDAEVIKNEYENIIDQDIYNMFRNIHIICSICQATFIYTNEIDD